MTDSTSSSSSSGRSWVPRVPATLQRLFDAVPLVTYGPNELPLRSPGASDLPTLHVFITEHDAARGAPSFNPSCLKWQTFLRIAGVRFHLRPSTNHASPTGALPFLLPPLSTITPTTTTTATTQTTTNTDRYARLDGRSTRPIPSSRLEAYASQHGALPPPTVTDQAPTPQLQSQARRRQAYQSLLDGPLRTAWLYSLYLSPANEPLLRRWYVDPASRSQLVRDALLRRVRAVAREEVARSAEGTSVDGGGGSGGGSWKLSGNVGDLLSWALAGTPAIDPDRIYADARRGLGALETLLYAGAEGEADNKELGAGGDGEQGSSGWFFGAPHPTLFDAAVFSYIYLILNGARASSSDPASSDGEKDLGGRGGEAAWGDDTLRRIVLECPRLVAHARRIVDSYWADLDDGGWVSLDH